MIKSYLQQRTIKKQLTEAGTSMDTSCILYSHCAKEIQDVLGRAPVQTEAIYLAAYFLANATHGMNRKDAATTSSRVVDMARKIDVDQRKLDTRKD